ncbi:MAG: hypothetical protein CSA70_01385 [Rhodobacterales bacterium]|nr:MAG: hypothetical protein CSA70_01385 [Rhodobacterales bacterium]
MRIATEGAFPPFNHRAGDGTLSGFEIDLGQLLCARMGRRCEWVVTPWNRMIPGLRAKRFDMVMAGMADTTARRRKVAFSRGYALKSQNGPIVGLYVARDSFVTPESALIAVQSDTVHESHLADLGRRIQRHPTAQAALDAVLDHRADVVFGSPSFLEPKVFRASRSLTLLGREEMKAHGAAVALRHEDEPLLLAINAAMDALEADGTLAALHRKWFVQSTDL